MKNIFNIDNPFFAALNKLTDVILLNLLFIVCCLPVITIGASLTAMYYTTVKMVRKEESYMWKDFFKSFKQNFGQATVIWLINMVVIAIFVADLLINRANPDMLPAFMIILIIVIGLIAASVMIYSYPMLSHFDNTISKTLKNSAILAIVNLPQTILFLILAAIPFVLVYLSSYYPQIFPVVLIIGFSGPAYIASLEWDKIFKKIEPKASEATEEVIEGTEEPQQVDE